MITSSIGGLFLSAIVKLLGGVAGRHAGDQTMKGSSLRSARAVLSPTGSSLDRALRRLAAEAACAIAVSQASGSSQDGVKIRGVSRQGDVRQRLGVRVRCIGNHSDGWGRSDRWDGSGEEWRGGLGDGASSTSCCGDESSSRRLPQARGQGRKCSIGVSRVQCVPAAKPCCLASSLGLGVDHRARGIASSD